MFASVRRVVLAGLLGACLQGCAFGLLYTHVVVPLDLDVDDTPVEPETGKSPWKTFSFVVHVDWDSAAIADAAHEAGITHIWYADMEIYSVLIFWQERTAIVYGTGD
jgi:TRL-like protein family